ncbi:hypothetical protein BGZ83_006159 [Gryganskiella cystojenkinii]|nr:hypothetical protein BGZ83_006159 [Gryganskiella cystojenkinii]
MSPTLKTNDTIVNNGEKSMTFLKGATIVVMGLGTGSSLSVNVAVMPALAKIPTSIAARLWTEMVLPATIIQVSAFVFGFLGGMALYYETKNKYYLYGGLIMASIFPYTLAMFVPINQELFMFVKSGLEDVDGSIAEKMWIWNRNQIGRTALNTAGFLTTLFGALTEDKQARSKYDKAQ